ncbi:PRP1 splicing factor, N-terminal-domain-containing protein [Mycena crocata]|nr:PRP1 splicing factor, N-terminal-domain-containing protein [Mycena crocata]
MSFKDRLAFLSMPAPSSYVAGLGRGASGFTTRFDIGPPRDPPSREFSQEAQGHRGDVSEYDSEAFQDENDSSQPGAEYGAEDDAADEIFEKIDREMGSRRKTHREMQSTQQKPPKIQAQFADLKRGLASVTDEEWEQIPEVSSLTKRQKVRETRLYAVPDSVIIGDRNRLGLEGQLSAEQQEMGDPTIKATDLVELGTARDKILKVLSDQASAPASSTSINSAEYLTGLDSAVIHTDAEIGDIKKARLLFDSMVKSNPTYAQGWIAAACVEEHAGKMAAARKLITAGCQQCPGSEEIWLEAARLHHTNDAKIILAHSIQHVHQSVKIWLMAANLEAGTDAKRRVLRKALESIPNSVTLWKAAISLETSASDARLLLARSVEINPQSVELWLALARLEPFEQAKAVLNEAGAANATNSEVWIAAAHLVENNGGNHDEIDHTIATAVRKLSNLGLSLTREQWLAEAERSDEAGMPLTCDAIIKSTISVNLEQQDQIPTWLSDIEDMHSKGRIMTARAIAAYMLKVFPDHADVWEKALEIEEKAGAGSLKDTLLEQAVERCPTAETIWLMWAKKKWSDGDAPAAREVMERAFTANPHSERIWLAAVKLETDNDIARALLLRARDAVDTQLVWMKAAVFERQQGNLDEALSITVDGLSKFPTFAKLYMIQGQINTNLGRTAAARASFSAGLKACPKEPNLWILASRLEEKEKKNIKARSLLEKARLLLPEEEIIWAEALHVEERFGSATAARSMLSRGLQVCPASGYLWSMRVWSEPRATRNSRAADALTKSAKHPLVLCTIARMFWADRKIDKARDWFDRAARDGMDIGDIWAWWFRFERQYGTQDQQLSVVSQCTTASPRHGHMWESVAKDDKNRMKSTAQILDLVSAALHGFTA